MVIEEVVMSDSVKTDETENISHLERIKNEWPMIMIFTSVLVGGVIGTAGLCYWFFVVLPIKPIQWN